MSPATPESDSEDTQTTHAAERQRAHQRAGFHPSVRTGLHRPARSMPFGTQVKVKGTSTPRVRVSVNSTGPAHQTPTSRTNAHEIQILVVSFRACEESPCVTYFRFTQSSIPLRTHPSLILSLSKDLDSRSPDPRFHTSPPNHKKASGRPTGRPPAYPDVLCLPSCVLNPRS